MKEKISVFFHYPLGRKVFTIFNYFLLTGAALIQERCVSCLWILHLSHIIL